MPNKRFFLFLILLTLTGCALTRGGPCGELSYQWHDLTVNDLIATWGKPDQCIKLKNHHRLLVYVEPPCSNKLIGPEHELIPYSKKLKSQDLSKPCYVQFDVNCHCIIEKVTSCGNCVGDKFIPFECLYDAPCWEGSCCSS